MIAHFVQGARDTMMIANVKFTRTQTTGSGKNIIAYCGYVYFECKINQ